jgi:hypothetical protein
MGILLFLLKLQPTLYPRYASSIFLYIVDMSQIFFHAPLTSNAKLTRFFVRDSKIYKCNYFRKIAINASLTYMGFPCICIQDSSLISLRLRQFGLNMRIQYTCKQTRTTTT